MLSSDTIATSLIRFHEQQTEKIEVFWIEAASSRQQLMSELTAHFSGRPILVALVNKDRFHDANGVSDDLNLTIQENDAWFNPENRNLVRDCQKFSLVLVSKRPLGIPQLSSPVTLPDWFPQWPCEILTAEVKSVFSSITLSLGSPDIPQSAISSALFELERTLCNRLQVVTQSTPIAANALMAVVGTGLAPVNVTDLIASSAQGQQARIGSEFRPGGGIDSGFIVSHLARVWRDCPPAQRQSLATHASVALGLSHASSVDPQYSLTALLSRGKEKFSATPAHITFSRNLMVMVSDAVQFVNGIHHADEFPQFPAVLTITFARDLANSCRTAASTLGRIS
jgi:hypothetical protein